MLARLLRLTLLSCLLATPAFAQNLRVLTVPWNQADPSVPHAAYNGNPTTFKAIARGGNGTYTVEWDFQGDGVFDTSVVQTDRYDLGATFTYPAQATRVTFDAVVRVTSNGQVVTAVYPVRVEPDVPSDPSNATSRQLQVMRAVAIDDALWWMHTNMTRSGDEENPITGAQITGDLAHTSINGTFYGRPQSSSAFLWALGLNGHYAGFPAAYIGEFLPGQDAVNEFRWQTDPYAEDAARLLNGILLRASVVTVTAADETNNVGVYPEVTLTPIPGTDDLVGLYFGGSAGDQTTNPMGYAVAALSVSHLTGLVAQVGDANRILGKPFELIIQQAVDALTWAQMDSGCGIGGWYYSPNAATCPDGWENISALNALWVADERMSSSGVIVNNQVKIRQAIPFVNLAFAYDADESCVRYSGSGTGCDYGITAGAVQLGGWMGFDQFDPSDTRIAFPGYAAFTRGQLRTAYNRYRAFVENRYTTWQENTDTSWSGGLWELGGGGTVDHERTDGQGNSWSMFQLANAARAHESEIITYGGQNWFRHYSIYSIQNQFADGHLESTWPNAHWEVTGGLEWLTTGWMTLILTGDGIPPYGIADLSTTSAPEGTPITFDAGASDPGTEGATGWTWSFGNGASATGATAIYAYPDNGTFNATLSGPTGSGTDTVALTITNAPPVVDAGADVTVPEGSGGVDFAAVFTDPGANDTHTYGWDFDDGTTSSVLDPPIHLYPADDGNFAVVVTVTDDDNGVGTDTVDVTIENVAPAITSTPGLTATEGAAYAYTLTFTDPGTLDTHACSLPTKPTGMTLTGCTANWAPSYAGLAGATSAGVEICVTDDDMGETCDAFTVAVALTDADADGLPDGWEIDFFGNIAAQSGAGDPDLDGRTNAQEFADVQDPTAFGGPSAPVLLTPANGTVTAEQDVTLVLLDSTDPTGDALVYDVELATDAAFSAIVATTAGLAETAGSTSWAPSTALSEDARYCWRARADDGAAKSPWSVPACFLRSATNDPPGTPAPLSPAAGSTAGSIRPLLSWLETADPESDAVFYDVELATTADFASPLGSASGVPGGNAVIAVDLADDGTTYYWRVRGVDGSGVAGSWSSAADFQVDTRSGGDGSGDSGGGCGCSLAPNDGRPALSFALSILAAAAVLLRRRSERNDVTTGHE